MDRHGLQAALAMTLYSMVKGLSKPQRDFSHRLLTRNGGAVQTLRREGS